MIGNLLKNVRERVLAVQEEAHNDDRSVKRVRLPPLVFDTLKDEFADASRGNGRVYDSAKENEPGGLYVSGVLIERDESMSSFEADLRD